MANVALSALVGGGVKSIQSDWVSETTLSEGDSGSETDVYVDVTLSTAVDTSKCVVLFTGGCASSVAYARQQSRDGAASTIDTYLVTGQLTSSTNLRLGSLGDSSDYIAGRWTVIEYY